jgi:hypothetical protein
MATLYRWPRNYSDKKRSNSLIRAITAKFAFLQEDPARHALPRHRNVSVPGSTPNSTIWHQIELTSARAESCIRRTSTPPVSGGPTVCGEQRLRYLDNGLTISDTGGEDRKNVRPDLTSVKSQCQDGVEASSRGCFTLFF